MEAVDNQNLPVVAVIKGVSNGGGRRIALVFFFYLGATGYKLEKGSFLLGIKILDDLPQCSYSGMLIKIPILVFRVASKIGHICARTHIIGVIANT